MALWNLASNASAWRDYDFYREGTIVSYDIMSAEAYESLKKEELQRELLSALIELEEREHQY
ncbi:MAG: hypothetical protein VB027_12500 [Gordonibacter sp.]|nr:hypothetical protein [Gordonibacter sp.]